VNGIDISDPIAMHNSTLPSWGSDASSRSRTAGRRDTQVANSRPLTANAA
jgi:hypothetical protein